MVRKDGAEARKQRIQEIAQTIHRSLNPVGAISLSKTIAALQYETGLTKERITEYLRILEKLDHFTLDVENDKIENHVGLSSEELAVLHAQACEEPDRSKVQRSD